MVYTLTGGSGTDFKPVPAGLHFARCIEVIDLGTHLNTKYDKKEGRIRLGFEVPEFRTEEGEAMTIGSIYPAKLHSKAILGSHLANWRGGPFTPEELQGFNPRLLLDVPTSITVVHNESGGKTYGNISMLNPAPSTPHPDREHELFFYSIEDSGKDVFDKLYPWLQEMVLKSDEGQRKYGTAIGQDAQSEPIYDPPEARPNPEEDVPF